MGKCQPHQERSPLESQQINQHYWISLGLHLISLAFLFRVLLQQIQQSAKVREEGFIS